MSNIPPFHLAFPVHDIEETRRFYGDLLGCPEGRRAVDWVDFNFFGHQIGRPPATAGSNAVDGRYVPVPHFGVVLDWHVWQDVARRLEAAGVEFLIKPAIRFEGMTGEQGTLFFLDPSGNAIELKAMRNPDHLFAR